MYYPRTRCLTDEMLDIYDRAGVILLRDFVSAKACKALRERGQDLLCSYSPEASASPVTYPTRSDKRQCSFIVAIAINREYQRLRK